TVCVVGKMRDLILQLSKSSIYSTKPLISFICEGKRGDRRIEELQFIPYVQRTHPEVLTFQEWISPVD
ncbi:hypothetical protein M8T47_23960, partial [Enterobacter hormaechei]|nr:hypothetical protein [Enterobacter hormaechei]MCM8024219.1 hypothetical protein [Enterobacter hormaechei]